MHGPGADNGFWKKGLDSRGDSRGDSRWIAVGHASRTDETKRLSLQSRLAKADPSLKCFRS